MFCLYLCTQPWRHGNPRPRAPMSSVASAESRLPLVSPEHRHNACPPATIQLCCFQLQEPQLPHLQNVPPMEDVVVWWVKPTCGMPYSIPRPWVQVLTASQPAPCSGT